MRRRFTPREAVNAAARAIARARGCYVGDEVDLVLLAELGDAGALEHAALGEAAARALLDGEAGEEGWVRRAVEEAAAERSRARSAASRRAVSADPFAGWPAARRRGGAS